MSADRTSVQSSVATTGTGPTCLGPRGLSGRARSFLRPSLPRATIWSSLFRGEAASSREEAAGGSFRFRDGIRSGAFARIATPAHSGER